MAWRVMALPGLAAGLTAGFSSAHADQMPRLLAALSQAPPPTQLTVLSVLSCLAALLSCACSIALWRRVDVGQEAAKSSMYAAGKLFDNAARRFARAQDEALGGVEAAIGAAGQAGQASARLATAVREAETRLSACLGESEARLHEAAATLSRHEGAVAEAFSALSGQLGRDLRDVLAEAMEVADSGARSTLHEAARGLQSRSDQLTHAAEALPAAGIALGEAAEAFTEAQARHTALIGRVEALASVLPSIATSLASTAAGQRTLLSQSRQGLESGVQEMRHAASRLSASVEWAGIHLRRRIEEGDLPPGRPTPDPAAPDQPRSYISEPLVQPG